MNSELESLSPKQRLQIRAARSSSKQEHLEVLRMMERHLSELDEPDWSTRRDFGAMEAVLNFKLGRTAEALSIFRDLIARSRGRSRDALVSVLASHLAGKDLSREDERQTLVEILNFPADPMYRAELLYQTLGLRSTEQILEQITWQAIVGAFFEQSNVGDRQCTMESFRSYAADFFADRKRLNRAVAEGREAREVKLTTDYWEDRSKGYPSAIGPKD